MYAPVGTEAFTALLLIEDPDIIRGGSISMHPVSRDVPLSPFSFNMENYISIYENSYYDDGRQGIIGDAITLTVTLTEPLDPTDNITTYRYFFDTSINTRIQRAIDYDQAQVIIYERSKCVYQSMHMHAPH